LVLGPPVFDRKVRALGIAGVFQALVKGLHAVGKAGRRYGAEETDHRHLLRARRERPKNRRRGCSAAAERDQLSAVHSTTSSARSMNARRPRPGMTSSSACASIIHDTQTATAGRRFAAPDPGSGWIAGPWEKAESF